MTGQIITSAMCGFFVGLGVGIALMIADDVKKWEQRWKDWRK